VHPVGFIVRMYHAARSPERQYHNTVSVPRLYGVTRSGDTERWTQWRQYDRRR